jgi:fructose-1,6-bisphosphatase
MSEKTESAGTLPVITVQQHILQEQKRFPGASGEFSWLLSGITMASKLIQAKVRRAGLSDILGEQGAVNVQVKFNKNWMSIPTRYSFIV